MSYLSLILSSSLFLILHFVSATNIRKSFIEKRGEAAWMILFSLLSLFLFGWMIYAYQAIEGEVLTWAVPIWLYWISAILMFNAMAFLILGYLPLITKSKSILVGVTRHPIMWAVVFYALAHMLSNSKISSLIFYGSMLLTGLIGSYLLDKRKAQNQSMNAQKLFARTSWLPFLALLQGRSEFKFSDIKLWHWGVIVVVYAGIIYLHGFI